MSARACRFESGSGYHLSFLLLVNLIGIDAATRPEKTGLAFATWEPEAGLWVKELRFAAPEGVLDIVRPWFKEPALVCIDAPLGWPAAMTTLAEHRAGESLGLDWGQHFIRQTDRLVHQKLGKKPLEVAADRIARTAAKAVGWLGEWNLPLAWEPGPGVIEVYPAAVLLAHHLSERGYKKPEQTARRLELLKALSPHWDLPVQLHQQAANHTDLLDALLCLLGGVDFLTGRCLPPEDLELAQKEGWIWFVPPAEASGKN